MNLDKDDVSVGSNLEHDLLDAMMSGVGKQNLQQTRYAKDESSISSRDGKSVALSRNLSNHSIATKVSETVAEVKGYSERAQWKKDVQLKKEYDIIKSKQLENLSEIKEEEG